jgi:hypothetical protein
MRPRRGRRTDNAADKAILKFRMEVAPDGHTAHVTWKSLTSGKSGAYSMTKELASVFVVSAGSARNPVRRSIGIGVQTMSGLDAPGSGPGQAPSSPQ